MDDHGDAARHTDATRRGRCVAGGAGAALCLAAALASAPAAAQWAVVDVPHTMKTVLGWTAQYQQMTESYQRQVEQLRTLEKQYEQALVTGAAYRGGAGYRERFAERELDAGLVQRCGGTPPRHPKGTDQHAFCGEIVRMENRRFNALVAMLADVDARDAELRAAFEERGAIRPEEEGKLASNTNRILAIQARLQNDLQNAGALVSAYDGALRALRDRQVHAGGEALGGSRGTGFVQGLALKGALRVARERER